VIGAVVAGAVIAGVALLVYVLRSLSALCEALECQPGDILRWEPDSSPEDVATPTAAHQGR